MEERFHLPVLHNGSELIFPARLTKLGYTYKIEVDLYDTTIFFDRDEERNWRAVIDPDKVSKRIDRELIQSALQSIESHF